MTTTLSRRPRRHNDPSAPAAQGPARRHGVGAKLGGLLGCLALVIGAVVLGLAVGARSVPFDETVRSLWAWLWNAPRPTGVADSSFVVIDLRMPRTVIGLIAGLCLGVSGALIQAVTRNPLADPGILGTTSGAAFALAIAAGFAGVTGAQGQLVIAFVGAAAATVSVYAIGSLGRGGGSPVRLVLAGTALGAVLAGVTSAITITDPQRFAVMTAWRSGSLVDRSWELVGPASIFIGVGLVIAVLLGGMLNAIALGDDLAAALGANVVLTRTLAIAAVTLLAGAATAMAGPIAFVGLMVPHVARWIVGPDQRWIIAYSALLGAALLVLADVVGRVVLSNQEVPAGIVTAFIGAPVLIFLVRRRTASEL